MNRPLSKAELDQLLATSAGILGVTMPPPMTRKEKLLRWAGLIKASKFKPRMGHLLEYQAQCYLDIYTWRHSPMSIAFADPVFREVGLENDTVGGTIRFFELSKEDLHTFSCNCGGAISARVMAKRIRALAGPTPSLTQRIINFIKSPML